MGGGSAVIEKPITKESRNRNDRGRNDRQDKVDKFESKSNRLGQGGKNNSKNNNGRGGKNNKQQVKQPTPPVQEKKEDEIKTITLPETMTIKELADAMKIQASAIIKKLFLEGVMVTVNQEIDFEKAEEIALEFNCIAEKEEKVDVIEELLHEQSYTICTFSLSTIFHFIKHITHIAWASFLAIGICIVRFLKPIIIRHNLRNILSPRTLSFRICILGLHVARIS